MKSSRAAIIWSALAICALAVLGAMTALTRDIRASQREHALAETRAELEENTRLALWRIDAAGSDILLRENQRPPSDYDTSSRPPSAPFGGTPAVRLHFQIRDGLLTSPDASGDPAKTGTLRQLLTANGDIRSLLERAALRHQAIRRNWEPETTTQLKQKAAQARQAPSKAQRSSADNQADYNRIELAQRSKLFSGQNPGVNNLNTYLENQAPQAGPNDTTNTAPAILEITGLSPSWIGAELFLIRNITREPGADDIIQGVWLDTTRLKQHLLTEVTDLLPDATLEPLPTPADDPLALVSFPFLLHRGQPPAIPSPPWNRALLTGWAAVLLALLAVTILVRGIMRLSERRASFVSAVTHELRTPLTTFRLYSEMLEGGVVKKQNQSQYLRVLTTEADRLTHLVENVLAFSRIERGNARSQVKTIPVGELLESFRDRLTSRLASANLTLDMRTDDPTPVRADTAAVEHILFNLIDNAAKYAANSTPPAVEIRTRSAGKHLAISVRDHGPGITDDDRSRIFRPFHKSARQAAESKPGVGLGLALSKRLAKSQHGDLTYTANAFELTLPATR
ncbi:MAG: sensor histidine kinase [Verrucomicrobiota bacterium JB025]|nr:HAMP domain-containing sensor histidine kinase [Verrucomicrobiota bacterium JB025]